MHTNDDQIRRMGATIIVAMQVAVHPGATPPTQSPNDPTATLASQLAPSTANQPASKPPKKTIIVIVTIIMMMVMMLIPVNNNENHNKKAASNNNRSKGSRRSPSRHLTHSRPPIGQPPMPASKLASFASQATAE